MGRYGSRSHTRGRSRGYLPLTRCDVEWAAMGAEAIRSCPNCQQLQAQLEAQRAQLETQQAQLEAQRAQLETQQAQLEAQRAQLDAFRRTMAQLEARLAAARKDSSTSSKPPSSDIVKPPKPPPPQGQDRRHIGGQPGHPKHQRALFPPEMVNGGSHDHFAELCPKCGHGLQPTTAEPRVVQQIEVPEVPLRIEEHCSHPGWCPHCQEVRYAELPSTIERGGLVGPRLTTLIAFLKGVCHASYSTIRKFLRDVVRVTISRGQLKKIIGKVSRALDGPYQELLEDLPFQARLNIDETG